MYPSRRYLPLKSHAVILHPTLVHLPLPLPARTVAIARRVLASRRQRRVVMPLCYPRTYRIWSGSPNKDDQCEFVAPAVCTLPRLAGRRLRLDYMVFGLLIAPPGSGTGRQHRDDSLRLGRLTPTLYSRSCKH